MWCPTGEAIRLTMGSPRVSRHTCATQFRSTADSVWWVFMTPFGSPVVPEVKPTWHSARGSGAGSSTLGASSSEDRGLTPFPSGPAPAGPPATTTCRTDGSPPRRPSTSARGLLLPNRSATTTTAAPVRRRMTSTSRSP